jgi:hypothetical protein
LSTTPANMDHGVLSDAVTEAAAKIRSCPFMGGSPCVSSRCMGWRWIGHAFETIKVPLGTKPEGDDWVSLGNSVWRRAREGRKGYCGAIPGTAQVLQQDL